MSTTFQQIVRTVTADAGLHARFLNTLSMMENIGARKISRNEHPVTTDLMILKHAAEEARHAYYLKKQISKLGKGLCPDYSWPYLLAPLASYHFLHRLDVEAARLLHEMQCTPERVKKGAYLLVTYAIEVRAEMLYRVYQERLTEIGSKVNVKSIIAEEDTHLEEMDKMLRAFDPRWEEMARKICAIEGAYFETWVSEVGKGLNLNNPLPVA